MSFSTLFLEKEVKGGLFWTCTLLSGILQAKNESILKRFLMVIKKKTAGINAEQPQYRHSEKLHKDSVFLHRYAGIDVSTVKECVCGRF